MKTCPICNATCCDDMEICFECLHDFSAGIIDVSEAECGELYSPEIRNSANELPSGQSETLVVPALTVARNNETDTNAIIQSETGERTIVITLQGFDKDTVVKIQ